MVAGPCIMRRPVWPPLVDRFVASFWGPHMVVPPVIKMVLYKGKSTNHRGFNWGAPFLEKPILLMALMNGSCVLGVH